MLKLNAVTNRLTSYSPWLIWGLALVATLGSLGLSEIWGLVPCVLCWYQRILIYPLVLIVPVGIVKRDRYLPYYVLSLTLPGVALAGYHSLLQWRLIPESVAPCVNGVSCAEVQLSFWGFATIPFLSLMGFVAITVLAILMLKGAPRD